MNRNPPTVIICEHSTYLATAQNLSQHLQLPLFTQVDSALGQYQFALVFEPQGLQLTKLGEKTLGPLRVDLLNGGLSFRRQQDLGKELLAKAVGIRGELQPLVWDMTAGLGQDSVILAGLGCETHLFERNGIVHALLADGIRRARKCLDRDADTIKLFNRMTLHNRDGITALSASDLTVPDVVYIDPMFPEKRKNAKAKKAMQYCHQIVGKDEDADNLLAAALKKAQYRVVVKRPRSAPCLGLEKELQKPSSQLMGKTVRYDIYALKSTATYLSRGPLEEKKAIIR